MHPLIVGDLADSFYGELGGGEDAGALDVDAVDAEEGVYDGLSAVGGEGIGE